mmetsp:Transcript_53766/g.88615  ORF Transcript_53766/g.88615 Transcript_53766/m.88615 type:complete len:259 (+) Transcript_53766:609-1385(+)
MQLEGVAGGAEEHNGHRNTGHTPDRNWRIFWLHCPLCSSSTKSLASQCNLPTLTLTWSPSFLFFFCFWTIDTSGEPPTPDAVRVIAFESFTERDLCFGDVVEVKEYAHSPPLTSVMGHSWRTTMHPASNTREKEGQCSGFTEWQHFITPCESCTEGPMQNTTTEQNSTTTNRRCQGPKLQQTGNPKGTWEGGLNVHRRLCYKLAVDKSDVASTRFTGLIPWAEPWNCFHSLPKSASWNQQCSSDIAPHDDRPVRCLTR